MAAPGEKVILYTVGLEFLDSHRVVAVVFNIDMQGVVTLDQVYTTTDVYNKLVEQGEF